MPRTILDGIEWPSVKSAGLLADRILMSDPDPDMDAAHDIIARYQKLLTCPSRERNWIVAQIRRDAKAE